MRLLSPALGRLQAELLHPMINRVYQILARKQRFEAAPDFMANGQIDIEYVSPLAKAQRSGDVQSAMQLFQFLQPLLQIDPSVVDYLDLDGLAQHIIKVTNVQASVVRGAGQVNELRQQRAQQEQEMAAMQQAQMAAQAAGEAAPALRAVDGASDEAKADIAALLGQ